MLSVTTVQACDMPFTTRNREFGCKDGWVGLSYKIVLGGICTKTRVEEKIMRKGRIKRRKTKRENKVGKASIRRKDGWGSWWVRFGEPGSWS